MNHNTVVLFGWIVGIVFLAVPFVVGLGIYLTDQKNKVKGPKEDKKKNEKKSIFARDTKEKTSLIAKKSGVSKETQVASVFGAGGSGFTLPSSEQNVASPTFVAPPAPHPVELDVNETPSEASRNLDRPLPPPPPSLR